MARNASPLTVWSQYLAVRLAVTAATCFDVDTTHYWARQVAGVAYRLDRRHRERCCRNISFALPHLTGDQVEELARLSLEHFAQLVMDVCHTPRLLSLDTWANHTVIRKLGPAIELLNSPRPTLLVTGHLGNWEVLGYLLGTLGYDADAVARPIDNPLINKWMLSVRQRRGMRIITKFDAAERMLAVLDRGGALGFIADQNAGDKGLFVPFFGRLASTYKSIGLLAIRKRAAVVCGYAHRLPRHDPHPRPDAGHPPKDPRQAQARNQNAAAGDAPGSNTSTDDDAGDTFEGDSAKDTSGGGGVTSGGGGYRFELGVSDVIYPEDWADRDDPLFYITARYCRAIETMVRMRPSQYLWMHRRWKSRPRHEREGKPMPAKLRGKLEALPWMTPALLEQLSHPLDPAFAAPP